MNINLHISSLLFRYQCVTVPGFGAFLTEIQSAQLNGSDVSFNPPTKVVSFNANIKNNDGLLANHIASEEKISYDDAVQSITFAVSKWLHSLHNREVLTLENIGNIKLSSELTWFFEPFNNTNYFTSSFGLSGFISPAVKRVELKKAVEQLDVIAPVIFSSEKQQNYSYLKYAAAFLLFGLAGTYGYKMHYDNQIQQQTLVIEKNVQDKVQATIEQATFVIDVPFNDLNEGLEVVSKKFPFHLVSGVFSKEKNAVREYENLIKSGFKAELGPKNKRGMTPVFFQSFSDYDEAKAYLFELRNSTYNRAWLMID
ncbi:SPOR domain-containing protein [uncultured Flavobacterium sp.]|uniref:HU domain-containing protein n=1 Tax=uncultured Flavobacterium sp. TaxID=165435 RepID=UPI0030CA3E35|tara:strand:- start:823 stop:1758 length:936 start_codon:yes stop_codon:yes gene_type:complete